MAIGDTSIIKDANGVSITVKDIASDCLIEQVDGTYHRENYRTDETMIQSGWVQSLGESRCYRKLPGGQIYIFGYGDLTTNASGTATQTITLPIAFPNEFVSLTDGIYEIGDSTWTVGQLILMKVGLSQVKIVINGAAPNKTFRVSFEAKGY